MIRTLYHGDNLDFLRSLPSESVDLIATDPPFNSGRDWGAYDDRWAWNGLEPTALIQLARANHSDAMAGYLEFMSPRLVECYRALRPTGSLYLQCDSAANSYLRILLDGIFGSSQFRNEIAWKRAYAHNDAKRYSNVLDSLFYYTKSDDHTWNPYRLPLDPAMVDRWYRNDAKDGRGRYNCLRLSAPGTVENDVWRGITLTNRMWNAPRRGKVAEIIEQDYIPGYRGIESVYDRLDALDTVGLIHWPQKDGGIPQLKQYESMSVGTAPSTLFDDLPMMRDLPKERTGYPTQKPLALYDRIIRASSNPGDLILDPFAGSGTTLIAAERLGRQWIGMDLWPDSSLKVVLDRIVGEGVSIANIEYVSQTPATGG